MTPWRTISIALQASTAGYISGMGGAAAATKSFGSAAESNLNKADKAADRSAGRWKAFGKAAMVGMAGVAIAAGIALKTAIEWESAWAGVTKTVDGTTEQLDQLEGALLGLARELPASRTEIAGVAEAAGQLGIERENIAQFTETMIAMGVSTNLAAEDAATGMARFMNVMGTAPEDVERLGATIVDLGNKGASTEAEILEMAQRIAGAGNLVGATEAEVLALSNALSSVGVEAQLGGGSIQRVFLKMYDAAQAGGDKMEAFAETAGMTATSFQREWEAAPMQTFNKVVAGLSRIKDAGGNVSAALADMGIKGSQERSVMLRLLGASDLLTKSLKDGDKAWAEGSALAEEAAKRYATAESKLKVFGNKVTDVARILGAQLILMLLGALDTAEKFGAWLQTVGISAADKLKGAWKNLTDAGEDVADVLQEMWKRAKPTVEILAKVGGAAVIGAIAGLAKSLQVVAGFLADNEAAVQILMTALVALAGAKALPIMIGLVSALQVKWLALVASVTGTAIGSALAGVATGFAMMGTSATAGAIQVRAAMSTLAGSISAVSIGFAGAAAGAFVLFQGIDKGHAKAKKQLDDLKPAEFDDRSIASMLDYQQSVADLAVEHENGAEEAHSFFGAIKGAGQMLTPYENSVLDAAIATGDYAEAARVAKESTDNLIAAYVAAGGRLGMSATEVESWIIKLNIPRDVIDNADALDAAISGAANAAKNGTPATDKLTTAYADLADETANATDQLKAWKELVDAVLGAQMGTFDATTKWRGSLSGLSEQIKSNSSGISALTEDGRANRDALSGAADSAIALAEAYGQTDAGIEGANIMLAASREELRKVLEQTGLTRAEAEAYLDTLGLTPDNIETIITANTDTAQERLDEVAAKLAETDGKVVTATVNVDFNAQRIDDWLSFGKYYGGGAARPPGRARGGPVTAGRSYLVGEHGPEIATFGANAFITPAKQTAAILAPQAPTVNIVGGGGGTQYHGGITNNITVPSANATPADIERALVRTFR